MSKNPLRKRSSAVSPRFIRRLSSWLVLSTALTLGVPRAARAQSLSWDPNDTSGANLGGSGTWNTTNPNWWTGTSDTTWISADTAVFGGSIGGTVTLTSPITAAGLVFSSSGFTGYTLTASPAETLTLGIGGITVNAGAPATTVGSSNLTLAMGAAQSFTNNSGSLLTIGGNITDSSNFLLTLNAASSGNINFSGAITGTPTSGLTVASTGLGAVILGGANTYTGATTVNSGALFLSGSINSSSSLVLGGGTLSVAPATAGPQTFAGSTVNAGFSTLNNPAPGNTVNLGAITHATGGLLNIATLTDQFSPIITGTTNVSNTLTNGIVGTWATVNSGISLAYAAGAAGGAVTAYPVSATALPATGGSATTNYDITTATTQTAAVTGYTLQVPNSVITSITLTQATFGVTLNGILNSGGAAGALTISGGTVTIGSNSELDIVSNTDATTISSVIANNGSNASALAFGSTNGGTLNLFGANTYTGNTIVGSGVLQLGNATTGSINGTGTVQISVGATLAVNQATTTSVTNTITDNGVVSGLEGSAITNTLSGVISGTGWLIQTGAGTTILSNTNTYTGPTFVSAGTLQVGSGATGTISSGTAVTVSGGGALAIDLAGGGTMSNNIANYGVITGLVASGH
jgi:fibronectin-binding autotransporter adhesin